MTTHSDVDLITLLRSVGGGFNDDKMMELLEALRGGSREHVDALISGTQARLARLTPACGCLLISLLEQAQAWHRRIDHSLSHAQAVAAAAGAAGAGIALSGVASDKTLVLALLCGAAQLAVSAGDLELAMQAYTALSRHSLRCMPVFSALGHIYHSRGEGPESQNHVVFPAHGWEWMPSCGASSRVRHSRKRQ